MTAAVFGNRYAGREPAWHKLGDVFGFDLKLTVTEALTRVNGLYRVEKVPMIVDAFGQSVNTGKYCLMREPVADDNVVRYFGEVSEDFEVIQTAQMAQWLDPISKRWPTETVGALGYGETVFMTLYAGEYSVRGEVVKVYFLVTDHKNASGKLRIAVVPVRVVCQNTLSMALRAAVVEVAIAHRKGAAMQAEWQIGLIERMDYSIDKTVDAMRIMADGKLTREEAIEIINQTYPEPKKPEEYDIFHEISAWLKDNAATAPVNDVQERINDQMAIAIPVNNYDVKMLRTEALRIGAVECYDKICDEYHAIANTPWAVYNAVVETEDYREGGTDINAAQSALYGNRARTKQTAFRLAQAAAA